MKAIEVNTYAPDSVCASLLDLGTGRPLVEANERTEADARARLLLQAANEATGLDLQVFVLRQEAERIAQDADHKERRAAAIRAALVAALEAAP